MILVRNVFQGHFGQAAELARIFKEETAGITPSSNYRVLTDLSGQFDTVVLEMEFESLAAWEDWRKTMFSSTDFAETFRRTTAMIGSGRCELYTIE